MIQEIPPDQWPAIIKALGPTGGVAVVAYLAVKGGLNGVKADVKEILSCQKKMEEKLNAHAVVIAAQDVKAEALARRVEILEDK